MTHPEQPSAVARAQSWPGRPGGRADPDLQRAGEPAAHRGPAARAAVPDADVAGARRQLPGRHRRGRRRARCRGRRRCTCCTGRGKEGLGAAYLAGFGWALDHGYDAAGRDGRRRLAPARAAAAAAGGPRRDADVVLGSRWVPGGEVVNWPLHRKVLSVGGNIYTRVLLGHAGRATPPAGYRVYRGGALRSSTCDDVASQGYCFQVDLPGAPCNGGLTVVEVPITFVEREVGDSKMSRDIVTRVAASASPGGAWHTAPGRPRLVAAPGAAMASPVGPAPAPPRTAPPGPAGCRGAGRACVQGTPGHRRPAPVAAGRDRAC